MVVAIKDLVKRYNELLAVDNVSIKIKEGEIFGLLGPNGAGKTTTINILLGLTKIDAGKVEIFGKDFNSHENEIKKHIGLVPQEISVFEDLTAYENVMFFGKLYGLSKTVLKANVKEALEFTGLWERRKDFPTKFSGGMKRRLNIACAIVHQPKLIIMDEPTVGIDPQSRKHILESVKKLNERGSTVIYTSHYMEEIEEICTYITIMDYGRVIANGTKEELKGLVASDEIAEITVEGTNFSMIDDIKQIDGVKEAVNEEGVLTITSAKGSNNLGKIINTIADKGQEVTNVDIQKPTLETVFLTLTGRTLRD